MTTKNTFQHRRFAINWNYAPGSRPANEADFNEADYALREGNDRMSAALDLAWIVCCNETDVLFSGALPSEL